MLKSTLSAASLLIALGCGAALAQATTPAPPPPADTAAPPASTAPAPAPTMAPPGKITGHDLIASCRDDARSKGLKGDARRAAVHDCVAAQRPGLAARMDCHRQGKAQGLASTELKAFVKECVAKAKS